MSVFLQAGEYTATDLLRYAMQDLADSMGINEVESINRRLRALYDDLRKPQRNDCSGLSFKIRANPPVDGLENIAEIVERLAATAEGAVKT